MKKLIHLLLASLLLAGLLLATTAATAAAPYANNRAPLREKPFVKLPLGAIRAEGWLRDQLQRQADGLTGAPRFGLPRGDGPAQRLAGRRRRRLGTRPLLDRRLLPLAYILGDRQLIEKTRPWVEWRSAAGSPTAISARRKTVRSKAGHTARQRPATGGPRWSCSRSATILLGDGRRARHQN